MKRQESRIQESGARRPNPAAAFVGGEVLRLPTQIRWVETLPNATEVAAVAGRRSGAMRSADFARELGICPRTVRRMYERGELPGAREHGARILMVPTHYLRLATAYGLRRVGLMAKAGLLEALP